MNQDQRLSTVISLVLMLATASLGWLSVKDQLALPRIKDLRGSGGNPVSEQDVVARLWEDPLQAVQAEVSRPKDTNATRAHEPDAFKRLVNRKLKDGGRVCLLVVPIPGTAFPDDGEWRLRQRYSLEMALAQSGYQPDGDGRHLGYVTMDWLERERVHRTLCNNDNSSPPNQGEENAKSTKTDYSAFNTTPAVKALQVPYEWFAATEPSNHLSVLLVWLQNEYLVTEPLCRLAYLRHTLMPTNLAETNFAGTFFIGPQTSGDLAGIVAELDRLPASGGHLCAELLGNKLCLLSAEATAPDILVGLPPTNKWAEARGALDPLLHKKLGGTPDWTYFRNFIAPDDQLTDLLARELKLRNIDLSKGTDRVLVLTEADTSYGRALPQALLTSVDGLQEAFECNSSPTAMKIANARADPAAHANTNLIIARYLQGLDAQKGFQEDNKGGAKGSAGKTTAQALEEVLNKQAATAVGDSQLDYSERLAQRLAQEAAGGNVKAVGVLGGDVYDKLILLRSLRSRFPEALFFTTDLDARLWHPDHLRFTQNLIVASAYPVTPADEDTGFRMAPFRNGYQTAMFNASRAALILATNASATIRRAPAPEIYELGRDGPVCLQSADAASLTNTFQAHCRAAYGQFSEAFKRGKIVLLRHIGTVICALLSLTLTVLTLRYLYGHRHQPGNPEDRPLRLTDIFRARTGWAAQFFLGLVILLAACTIFVRGAGLLAGSEPWTWAKGVSIWPTELIRLGIVVAVVWMLVLSWQRFKLHRQFLQDEFFAPEASGETGTGIGSRSIVARQTWDEYLRKATLRNRYQRATAGAFAYLLMAVSLMILTGFPFNTQIRGGLAHGLDSISLAASVGALLLLLFYVLDAVWLSATVLEKLAQPFTVWNQTLAQKSADEFGVNREDVEGYLDVRFAAKKTEETGKLIFLPFIIQFFMLVSRNRYFDNWGWPLGLVAILVCNVVLAGIAWWLLRRAAAEVKQEALKKLSANLMTAELNIANGIKSSPLPQARKIGLLAIKAQIENEYRGAYSKWIQDPALLAMLIPTGLLGVLTVLFQALFR